jgi:hypothetical protein
MPESTALHTVLEFWRLMGTNDFDAVAGVLDEHFVLEWPQSNERIRGAERFARMNKEYETNGLWKFKLCRAIANEVDVVTEVEVTDGVQNARAISFFTVQQEKIIKLVEFWPEPYAAPSNRAHLVESIQ